MKTARQKTQNSALIMVSSAVIMLAFSVMVVLQKSSLLSRAQSFPCTSPNLPSSQIIYYGQAVPSTLLPVGSVIEIFNSRSQKVNCFTVTRQGVLGFTSIYSETESLEEGYPGMQEDEEIIFKVDGNRIYLSDFERYSSTSATWKYVNFLPAPPEGNSPVLNTSSLPAGQVGVPYRAIIQGRDLDMGQSYKLLSPSLLPAGLQLGACTSKYNSQLKVTEFVCKISGTPTQTSQAQLTFVVTDSGFRTASKMLGFTIR